MGAVDAVLSGELSGECASHSCVLASHLLPAVVQEIRSLRTASSGPQATTRRVLLCDCPHIARLTGYVHGALLCELCLDAPCGAGSRFLLFLLVQVDGYCFCNNTAIAAERAVRTPSSIMRTAALLRTSLCSVSGRHRQSPPPAPRPGSRRAQSSDHRHRRAPRQRHTEHLLRPRRRAHWCAKSCPPALIRSRNSPICHRHRARLRLPLFPCPVSMHQNMGAWEEGTAHAETGGTEEASESSARHKQFTLCMALLTPPALLTLPPIVSSHRLAQAPASAST